MRTDAIVANPAAQPDGFFGTIVGDGTPLVVLTALVLIGSGLFALFLSAEGHFLPHDEQFLGMTAKAFERKYVYRTRNQIRLRVPREKHCHFLRGEGCSIHPAKPAQCRIFPFWPELVSSRLEWLKTAAYCPGIGKGPLIRIASVQEQAREMREGHPGLYK